MKIVYEKQSLELAGKKIEYIKGTLDDNKTVLSIPLDPANSDYQAYLAQLDESETE
jgi:hypothetical protein